MQDFVSVRPPVISQFIKKREQEQTDKFFKSLLFAIGFIFTMGFAVGALAGWAIWG